MTQPLVAVLDYGIGNLRSAQKSLERVGADARLTADTGLIRDADAVVLPGVGNFGRVADEIRAAGLAEPAREAAASGRPFLGICVGMQVMFDASEETPGTPGLGILPGTVRLLPETVKRPQMQWNTLSVRGESPMFAGMGSATEPPWVYFVHSYAVEDTPATVATCDYGQPVVAAVAHEAIFATQFHPEKSGRNGLRLLANFVDSARAEKSEKSEKPEKSEK